MVMTTTSTSMPLRHARSPIARSACSPNEEAKAAVAGRGRTTARERRSGEGRWVSWTTRGEAIKWRVACRQNGCRSGRYQKDDPWGQRRIRRDSSVFRKKIAIAACVKQINLLPRMAATTLLCHTEGCIQRIGVVGSDDQLARNRQEHNEPHGGQAKPCGQVFASADNHDVWREIGASLAPVKKHRYAWEGEAALCLS